ncbi:MAG: hypothetical protein II903_11490 [Spirochaetales bacterium]|nr:hypothetical protein [Spirochaetales bacterium]MBQ7281781.1 hypothetical protein [Spirochaetales bacterium]
METTIRKTAPRSGWEFDKREKAYHSYMFSLQKKNYGVSLREYARTHNLTRDTLRSWVDRYPNGLPYYDADAPDQVAPEPPKGEIQMVKLSQSQLEEPHMQVVPKIEGNGIVIIEFHGARITTSSYTLVAVLAAIKSVSDPGR